METYRDIKAPCIGAVDGNYTICSISLYCGLNLWPLLMSGESELARRATSCVSIYLFADDILLLSPTSTGLQTLFNKLC